MEPAVLVQGPQVVQRELEARSAAIAWISCVTIRNFNNCDRSYNSSRKCWSLFFSKSAQATLSLLN